MLNHDNLCNKDNKGGVYKASCITNTHKKKSTLVYVHLRILEITRIVVERFVDGKVFLKVAKAAQRSEKISFLRLRRIKQLESLSGSKRS